MAYQDAMSRGNLLATLTPSRRVFVHHARPSPSRKQSINLNTSRMNAGKSSKRRSSYLGEKPLVPAVENLPCDDPKKTKKKTSEDDTFEGVCGPRKFKHDARVGCHPSTKPFVRGLEPIKCFSVPILAEHLRTHAPEEPWYCKRPNLPKFDQGLAAKEMARDARYQEKLLEMKAYERKMQVAIVFFEMP